jgi:hypothetical protein
MRRKWMVCLLVVAGTTGVMGLMPMFAKGESRLSASEMSRTWGGSCDGCDLGTTDECVKPDSCTKCHYSADPANATCSTLQGFKYSNLQFKTCAPADNTLSCFPATGTCSIVIHCLGPDPVMDYICQPPDTTDPCVANPHPDPQIPFYCANCTAGTKVRDGADTQHLDQCK